MICLVSFSTFSRWPRIGIGTVTIFFEGCLRLAVFGILVKFHCFDPEFAASVKYFMVTVQMAHSGAIVN